MKKNRLRLILLVFITILYGYGVGAFLKTQIDDYVNLISYISTFLAIFIGVYACLKVKSNRYVYISSNDGAMCQNVLIKLRKKFKLRRMLTPKEYMNPGDTKMDIMKHMLPMCSFCIVLIDGELSSFQKKEIKEMKRQKKKIIPILISDNSELPSILSNVAPLKLSDL